MEMNIGKHIKEIRKSRNLSVEYVADKLGVSPSTVYRYENSSITKIPISVIDSLCDILGVSTSELMGNVVDTPKEKEEKKSIGTSFENASDAMAFMLKMPVLAAYGGYDPESMDETQVVEFAEDLLQQLKIVSYKYKDMDIDRRFEK